MRFILTVEVYQCPQLLKISKLQMPRFRIYISGPTYSLKHNQKATIGKPATQNYKDQTSEINVNSLSNNILHNKKFVGE